MARIVEARKSACICNCRVRVRRKTALDMGANTCWPDEERRGGDRWCHWHALRKHRVGRRRLTVKQVCRSWRITPPYDGRRSKSQRFSQKLTSANSNRNPLQRAGATAGESHGRWSLRQRGSPCLRRERPISHCQASASREAQSYRQITGWRVLSTFRGLVA